jgi:hypothetical protein
MATLVAGRIDRPATLFGPAEDFGDVGGGPTLDDAIVGAWEGLVAHVAVACPLCGGPLAQAERGADAGSCGRCGTTLS